MRSSSSEDICFCAQRAVVSPGSAVIKQRPGFCGERGEIRVVQSPPLALLYFKCFKCFGPSLSLSLSLSLACKRGEISVNMSLLQINGDHRPDQQDHCSGINFINHLDAL